MKIAVLLRGQPRFSEHGARFFEKFVRERFPEHEFEIFIGTWKTVSNVMDKPLPKDAVIYGREYDQRLLGLDEVIKIVKNWKPKKFIVTLENELFDVLKTTYATLLKDEEKFAALRQIIQNEKGDPNGRHLVIPGHLDVIFESKDFLVDNLVWGNKLEYAEPVWELKRNIINTQYLLGQIFSAGKAYDIYNEWATDNNYKPDLIWYSRQDMIHWYNSPEAFDTMKRDLERMERDKDYPQVLADRVEVYDGRPWASDYNFYMLPDTATHLYSDIKQKISDWILNDTRLLMSAIGSGPALQHVLWLNFMRKCTIVPLHPFIKPKHSEVIRPKENIDELVEKTLAAPTTLETVEEFIKNTVREYNYPEANTPVPHDVIDEYYNLLSKN